MTIDSAANFFVGSILYTISYLIILAGVVVANNMIFKYWKSFGWKFYPWFGNPENANGRFMTDEEARLLEEAPKKTTRAKKQ